MHGYCTDEDKEARRKTIVGLLVAVSVPLTPLINSGIQKLLFYLKVNPTLASIIEWLTSNGMSFAVSYVAVFFFLYGGLNLFFGVKPISKLLGIPCLRGTWVGTLHSNYNGGTDTEMKLTIKQSWMKMKCTAIFPKSSSDSIMASVYQKNDEEARLEFAYRNESQETDVVQKDYYGFNYFVVRGETMKGFYFTNREMMTDIFTHGDMELTKQHGRLWKLLHKNSKSTQKVSN